VKQETVLVGDRVHRIGPVSCIVPLKQRQVRDLQAVAGVNDVSARGRRSRRCARSRGGRRCRPRRAPASSRPLVRPGLAATPVWTASPIWPLAVRIWRRRGAADRRHRYGEIDSPGAAPGVEVGARRLGCSTCLQHDVTWTRGHSANVSLAAGAANERPMAPPSPAVRRAVCGVNTKRSGTSKPVITPCRRATCAWAFQANRSASIVTSMNAGTSPSNGKTVRALTDCTAQGASDGRNRP